MADDHHERLRDRLADCQNERPVNRHESYLIAQQKSLIDAYRVQVQTMTARIAELEAEIERLSLDLAFKEGK